MNNFSPQERLIDELKRKFHKRFSHATQLSDLLDISMDSAYRRLRGEVQFTFDELLLLAKTYEISLDTFVKEVLDQQVILKQTPIERYISVMEGLYRDKLESTSFISIHSYLPILECANFPNLLKFKVFFIDQVTRDAEEELSMVQEEDKGYLVRISQRLKSIKSQKNRYETQTLYSYSILYQILQQISYCRNTGLITEKEFVFKILNDLFGWVEQLNKDLMDMQSSNITYYLSETDFHCNMTHSENSTSASTYLFFNETDAQYFHHMQSENSIKHWVDNVMPKTVLIKNQASTNRRHFINSLRKQLQLYCDKIELSP